MKKIKMSSAFVQGRGHNKQNIPCQDRTFSSSYGEVSIIALADGAGSCKLSHIGAEMVTKKIAELLISNFDKLYLTDYIKIQHFLISNLIITLDKYAIENKTNIKDLSSTLLFVAINNNNYIAGHLGDGVIGYKNTANEITVLSRPENGEYSNSTFFVPSEKSYKHFRIFKGDMNNIEGFIVMSDGSEESLYNKRTNILSSACLQMLNWLDKYSAQTVNKALHYNLEKFIKMKTYDDCSIGLIKFVEFDIQQIFEADLTIKKEFLFSDNTKYINNDVKILDSILNHNLSSLKDIADFTKISHRTVKSHINHLKEHNIIDIE
jgi:hypothetical protein